MAEKITNGAFATDLSGWTNTGEYSFEWYSGTARAQSALGSDISCTSRLIQSFGVQGSVVSAVLNALAIYHVAAGNSADGSVTFAIKLKKPGGTTVVLATEAYDVAGDGSSQIADDLDISANLNEVGTFQLWLEVTAVSSEHIVDDNETYLRSRGSYDNISLAVVEKMTKTVTEAIGGGEAPMGAGVESSDGMSISESLATAGGGAGTKLDSNKLGLFEALSRRVCAAILEGLGGGESFARSYGFLNHDIPGDGAGMAESMSARVMHGNVIRLIEFESTVWAPAAAAATTWEAEG